MTEYVTQSLIGVDFYTVTAGTTTDGAGAPFPLGTRVSGTNNTVWVMVQAAEAIATLVDNPLLLAININFQASIATQALVAAGNLVGWSPNIASIADNDIFWACLSGNNIPASLSASTSAGVRLFVSATAGRLTSASTSTRLDGVVAGTAASAVATGSGAMRLLEATYPLVANLAQ